MSTTRGTPYGFAPWHQTSWDWRAAGNFIGGGAGSGLVAFTALSDAAGAAQSALLLAGLALVGLGLASVALELGRPLRALNVVRNPFTSWMSREALCGGLLAASTLAAIAGVPGSLLAAAIFALAFLYCQSRLLQGSRGIPAWREPMLVPFVVATGVVEGAGLFWLSAPVHGAGTLPLLALFAALVVVRWFLWIVYRRRLEPGLAAGARDALEPAGRLLQYAGTYVPLVLAAVAPVAPAATALALASLAGIVAAVAGSVAKHVLVTRAGFNQGYALPKLPVRGTRS